MARVRRLFDTPKIFNVGSFGKSHSVYVASFRVSMLPDLSVYAVKAGFTALKQPWDRVARCGVHPKSRDEIHSIMCNLATLGTKYDKKCVNTERPEILVEPLAFAYMRDWNSENSARRAESQVLAVLRKNVDLLDAFDMEEKLMVDWTPTYPPSFAAHIPSHWFPPATFKGWVKDNELKNDVRGASETFYSETCIGIDFGARLLTDELTESTAKISQLDRRWDEFESCSKCRHWCGRSGCHYKQRWPESA